MVRSSRRSIIQLSLAFMLLFTSFLAAATGAQEAGFPSASGSRSQRASDPVATATPVADQSGATPNQPVEGEAITDKAALLQPAQLAPEVDEATADSNSDDSNVEPQAGEVAPSSSHEARQESLSIAPTAIQGVVTLDVSAPDTVRAGEYITYTYRYQNTGSQLADDIEIQAVWNNFKTVRDMNIAVWQWCPQAPDPALPGCGLLEASVQGPAVTAITSPSNTNGVRFRIGALGAGQSGQFSIRLRSNNAVYPQTAKAITRPAGSGKLFTSVAGGNGAATPTSEDTANTMIVGPVLVLTKSTAAGKLYPLETAEFVIVVGNATGSGDVVNGQVRADALPATNVVVKDVFPLGSEYVASSPAATINSNTASWVIPSLPVGQQVELRITFRKANVAVDCTKLNNMTYTATSDEMPMNGANRYAVAGSAVNLAMVQPLAVKSITAVPSAVVFGDVATITIVVQNWWNQPLSNIQLHYDLQSNAYYVLNSALPAPTASPAGTSLAGRVSWTFNMDAGSKTLPTEKSFTLQLRASYNKTGTNGKALLIPPAGVPEACIASRDGKVGINPRLEARKFTEVDPQTKLGDVYIVKRGQSFEYIIDVVNKGVEDAVNIDIVDSLPDGDGTANFEYIAGSATVNDQLLEPSVVDNRPGGTLIWQKLSIPSGDSIRLRYELKVDGRDYYKYCNLVGVVAGEEAISYLQKQVCVKMNPQIAVTKTADRPVVGPGEEVSFRLTLTNQESIPYRVGLLDLLGEWTFARQESGYAMPELVYEGEFLEWPLVDLAPGAQVEAVIWAIAPNVCLNKGYSNEVLFHNPTNYIQPIPKVVAKVNVACDRLEYSKLVDRAKIGLQDRHMYTLQIKNTNTADAITNVVVDDVLPQGFAYVGLEAASQVKSEPAISQRADGSTNLRWTIPTISKSTQLAIKYSARSGTVVGPHTGKLTAAADNTLAVCKGTCETIIEQGVPITYALRSISVEALMTIAPEIVPSTCATAGETRTYRLSLVNTNIHAYTGATISTTLPPGLSYVGPLGSTRAPDVTVDERGVTTLQWNDITIAKPINASFAMVVLEVEVKVGQVLGDLITVEQATSPDGAIPRKDGVQNATVRVCTTGPAVAIEATPRLVRVGDAVLYTITLVNTQPASLMATIEDQLPAGLSFEGMVSGPAPAIQGNTLSWNLVVPEASSTQGLGFLMLQFRARLASGAQPGDYQNALRVVSSSTPLDTSYSAVTIVGTLEATPTATTAAAKTPTAIPGGTMQPGTPTTAGTTQPGTPTTAGTGQAGTPTTAGTSQSGTPTTGPSNRPYKMFMPMLRKDRN